MCHVCICISQMYLCVCIKVCIFVYACMGLCIRVYAYVHMNMCICMYELYVCVIICLCRYECMHVCEYVNPYMHIWVFSFLKNSFILFYFFPEKFSTMYKGERTNVLTSTSINQHVKLCTLLNLQCLFDLLANVLND